MATRSKISLLTTLVAAVIAIGINSAHGAEIKAIASNAINEPYLQLVSRFEKESGHKVVTTWSGTEAIYKNVSSGEVTGIDFLGPLPPDIQLTTVYAAGLHAMAPAPDAAKALVRFLTGPEAATIIKNGGLEPG